MLSPLERDPQLVAKLGLITARWAALEEELSGLLGCLLRVNGAASTAYYSLANFSQRVDLVRALTTRSFKRKRDARIASVLFSKIQRLWKTRNYLVHSHYVRLTEFANGTTIVRQAESIFDNWLKDEKALYDGYAYQKHGSDGGTEYVKVNAGTFGNHADQLVKRARQVALLASSIDRYIVPLNYDGHHTSTRKPHPRSLRGRHPTPESGGS